MKPLLAIGEALIDFIPGESGKALKDVCSFRPTVGGAPANVCGAYSKLGGKSAIITQLGQDPFGDKIVEELTQYEIGCEFIQRTSVANTSLAFVALKEDGNREFSFYRKPGADMLLEQNNIKKEWFTNAFALHFCSVSLGDFPMKEAHKRAIDYALENKMIVSFDPNIRLALWEEEEKLRDTVLEFIPKAHILKISEEELEFITGKTKIEEAIELLFRGNVQVVLYTKGAEGATAFMKDKKVTARGYQVKAVDTTGAGDAFIGAFLYQLSTEKITAESLRDLSEEMLEKYIDFANKYCSLSVLKNGAIASYPSKEEME